MRTRKAVITQARGKLTLRAGARGRGRILQTHYVWNNPLSIDSAIRGLMEEAERRGLRVVEYDEATGVWFP
jgi:hypothetical protein